MVYVISQDGKPLMPCSNPIARLDRLQLTGQIF